MRPYTVLNVAYPLAPVGPDEVGGAEQVLSRIDRALVNAGHESIVIAAQGSTVAGTLLPVPQFRGPFTEDIKRRARENHRRTIEVALKKWPVDVVHLHGIDFMDYLPETDLPVVVTLHLPLSWYPQDAFERRRNVVLCCVSENQRLTAPDSCDPMLVVPNGVEIPQIRPHKHRYAITMGRICPEKGFHLAIDAAAAAEIPLVLGGRTFPYPEHEEYFWEEIAPRLGKRCHYEGCLRRDYRERLLSAAQCSIVPSLAPETSSLVAMESLAAGTPVVAFGNGALPEIVEHGLTGFIVGNVDEMAEAIHATSLLDPEACRAAAVERFSAEAMTARYMQIYEQAGLATMV